MQISVENTSLLGRKLTISISEEELKVKQDAKAKDYYVKIRKDNVSLKGFRAGKVPENVVRQKFAKQIKEESISELLETSLFDAIEKEKLEPAEQPKVESINEESGLQFVVRFEVLPHVELVELSKLEITKKTTTITEQDIDKGIERLQDKFCSWKETNGPAKDGDKLQIDFVGTINGEPFEHNSGQDVEVIIGSNKFIPGFEAGLIGASVTETPTLDLQFPKDYGHVELAGKKVVFTTKVNKIFVKELATIDEEFAKNLGIDSGDTNLVRSKVKENMEKYFSETIKKDLQEQAIDAFLNAHQIDLPESIVESEKASIIQSINQRQGSDPITFEELGDTQQEEVMTQAQRKSKLAILVKKLVNFYEIKVNEDKVTAKIDEVGALIGDIKLARKLYFDSPDMLDQVKHTVLSEQAIQFIIDNAKIKEEVSSFADIEYMSP